MTDFHFYVKFDQTLLLGKEAKNVPELMEGIRSAPERCIYYHTHRFLQQHHFLSPEPPNDFSYWVTEVLGDRVLGEQLSSIDTIQFENILSLRDRFVSLIESHLSSRARTAECFPGEEFHFMASRTFAMPTPYIAHNLGEFREILQRASISTLYFHIFDAKLRLKRGENDFSTWFDTNEMPALARAVRNLDPYTYTLEGLRRQILVLAKRYDPD
jgi:hypothetical protein